MAWKGRSDLEKLMRKANDRLRMLEKAGETRSTAYLEALRQMRIAEDDPTAARPRFSVSHFGTEKEMKQALDKFMDMGTSTVRGVRRQDVSTAAVIEKHTGEKIQPKEVKKIGDIWQAVRGKSSKYDAAFDQTRQKIIVKHRDKSPDTLKAVMEHMRQDKIPLDQWEASFDKYSKLEAAAEKPVDDLPLF